MEKGESVDSAIDYCIGNGILKDFLTNKVFLQACFQ